MALKLIALLFGAIIVLTRLPIVIWPRAFKGFLEKKVLKLGDNILKTLGAALFVVAFLFFYYLFSVLTLTQVVAVAFAVGLLFGAFMLSMPPFIRGLWKTVLTVPDGTLRLLASIAVLIGAAILYFVLPA